MKRRAAIYCRISQDREGAGLGVARQREDCEALASKLGWTVVAVYVDDDVSAYSGRKRTGYAALVGDLEAGTANAVLAWHTDRLHRSPRELEEYVDLCERQKVVTQTVKAGELDLATPSGRAVARTLGAWARFESEHKSDRIRRAHQQSAEAGRWRGGARPFGYRADAKHLEPSEAREVRRIYRRVLAGDSLGSIVRDLNDRAITTTTGRSWTYTTLRQMLKRPRNAGLSVYRGEVVGRGAWTPLVDEETWRAVTVLLSDPARRRSMSNRARWLGAGLYRCGLCAGSMRSGTSGNRDGTYRVVYSCRDCGRIGRTAVLVDEYVETVLVERLSRPDVLDVLSAASDAGGMEDLLVEEAQLRSRLDDLAALVADGTLTPTSARRESEKLRGRLDEVNGRQAAMVTTRPVAELLAAGDLARRWRGLDVERRRAVLDALAVVTLLPAGRGNLSSRPDVIAETVKVEWRRST